MMTAWNISVFKRGLSGYRREDISLSATLSKNGNTYKSTKRNGVGISLILYTSLPRGPLLHGVVHIYRVPQKIFTKQKGFT